MKIQLDISYKGSRQYIHGTDLFNAIQAAASGTISGKGAYVNKFGLSRFAYHLCELCLDQCAGTGAKVGEGELTLDDGSHTTFSLYETSQRPTERRPYDEDSMVAVAAFDGQSATLQAPIGYTTIEVVIALTKVLNYRLATPKQGKWVFGKIELNQALPTIKESVTITRTKGVPGRFSVNEIVIDGRNVGAIHFIVGTP